jgi:hypothetical protein
LVGLLCVVFLCHLADLPGTPHLVSEGPILDLLMVLVVIWSYGLGDVRCRAFRGRFDDGGWRSSCFGQSCSTRPIRGLCMLVRVFEMSGIY